MAPRFFLGRTPEGAECRFRHDVDAKLRDALTALCGQEPNDIGLRYPAHTGRYVELLRQAAPIRRTWAGPAYRFTRVPPTIPGAVHVTPDKAAVLDPDFRDWRENVRSCQPFIAIVVEARVVSVCCSVRIGSEVHEAGVETYHSQRGRGYGSQAVAAWAAAVRHSAAHPVYSTSWENVASLGIAKRLGLAQFGADFHVT